MFRLAPGAYFKYSSGGSPILMWSQGYGQEGKRDLDETYNFVLGEPGSLPPAAVAATLGVRAGSRRRILVPPNFGWAANPGVKPQAGHVRRQQAARQPSGGAAAAGAGRAPRRGPGRRGGAGRV